MLTLLILQKAREQEYQDEIVEINMVRTLFFAPFFDGLIQTVL